MSDVVHLRAAGVSLVLETRDESLPAVLHWGHDLGDLPPAELAALAVAARPATVPNDLDEPRRPGGVLPEHAAGWNGRPGVAGSRAGRGWSPLFTLVDLDVTPHPAGGGRVLATGSDDVAGLHVTVEIELLPAGLVRQRATLTATAPEPFTVDGLRSPCRCRPSPRKCSTWRAAGAGSARPNGCRSWWVHSRENRRGRTGPDAPLILAAGSAGFDTRSGEVWAMHVAWSGNHIAYAERLSLGDAVLGGGELLLAGEIALEAGRATRARGCTAPTASASTGSRRGSTRSSGPAPTTRAARGPSCATPGRRCTSTIPSTRLTELARLAADVGAERFVLDDGWFRGRRDDTAGLGDWYVDPAVWPTGLHPLIAAVAGSAWSSACGSSRR